MCSVAEDHGTPAASVRSNSNICQHERKLPQLAQCFERLIRSDGKDVDEKNSSQIPLSLHKYINFVRFYIAKCSKRIPADNNSQSTDSQLDLWLKKERKTRPPDNSYSHRDRGDSRDQSSAADRNPNESISLLEGDSTYKDRTLRSNSLKNKLHQKLTSLRNRNSFSSIRGDTDRLKSPEGTFYVHKIFGDGNCLYRSVSYIIWGDEEEHRSLRTMVVEHIKDNWWDYSAFVMAEWNISNRDEYYDYMIANGTYATELECVVATKLYHMNVSIYREINETRNLERIFHNRVNRNYRTARLLFSGRTESGHYDVLILD